MSCIDEMHIASKRSRTIVARFAAIVFDGGLVAAGDHMFPILSYPCTIFNHTFLNFKLHGRINTQRTCTTCDRTMGVN